MTTPKRRYIDFDPKSGYPGGRKVFYECVRCGGVVPSLPPDSVACTCGNVRIDVDYGRVAVTDDNHLRVFTIEAGKGT